MTSVDDQAEAAWASFLQPYRTEAERLGFRFIESRRMPGERTMRSEVAADVGRGMFLELIGEILVDELTVPASWWIRLTTYVETEHLLCRTTLGVATRPQPCGFTARLVRRLHDSIGDWLTPAVLRKVPLKDHTELESLVALHTRDVLSVNGKVLLPGSDPLESLRMLERRTEEEYDEDGVPKRRG